MLPTQLEKINFVDVEKRLKNILFLLPAKMSISAIKYFLETFLVGNYILAEIFIISENNSR